MGRTIAIALMVLVAGCTAAPPDVALRGPASDAPLAAPTDPATSAPAPPGRAGETAWRHLSVTEGILEGSVAAAAVESEARLEETWKQYHFPDVMPAVDFDRNVVLLLGQPDDDCLDQLIGLEVQDRKLKVTWLPPPGGCSQPLVFRIHAVEVDRRHLPARFAVAFPAPFDSEAAPATITIGTVEGDAPAPPQPPQAMTEAELDEVFKGHVIRRCTKADLELEVRRVDGPLSDDPGVARAQRARADFGVPSDEASTRAAMASPAQGEEDFGFPLLASELRHEMRMSRLTEKVQRRLRRHGYRRNVDVEVYLSRAGPIRPGVLVDGGRAAEVRRLLDDEFGNGAVLVVENRYDFEAIDQAQRDVGALMGAGDGGPGSIVSSTGIPGPVEIGMIDPTREALDRVAAAVDPQLVCVGVALSGVGGATSQDAGG